jgi:glycine/D-amino acid oxidase-like deaminating enzyme
VEGSGVAAGASGRSGAFLALGWSAGTLLDALARRSEVTGVVRRSGGPAVEGVEVDGELVGADAVVVAMGPFSQLSAGYLQQPDRRRGERRG